jgi:hypothetical protein
MYAVGMVDTVAIEEDGIARTDARSRFTNMSAGKRRNKQAARSRLRNVSRVGQIVICPEHGLPVCPLFSLALYYHSIEGEQSWLATATC